MEKFTKTPELVAEHSDGASSVAIEPEDGPPASRPYVGLHDDFEEQSNIRSLARTLTSASSTAGINYEPGTKEELDFIGLGSDPRLDPHSDAFESEYWIRSIRKLFEKGSDHYKPAELGVVLKGLRIMGRSADADFQTTVANWPAKALNMARSVIQGNKPENMFDIIKPLDALFKPGRVCVVLGRPGAGCSSLLKTVAVRTYGLTVTPESEINYDGITPSEIERNFRGDVIYSAESDSHFATLPVGYTLEFAARCRCPNVRFGGISREDYYKHYAAVVMAMYGLSHTYNTKVGDDYVRGVSGGERKRVSLAEVTLAGAKIQCWDNSTRGLDSATALEFVRAIKTNAEVMRTTSLIAIYQCSQETYNQFDDVLVLYEGYEIYFGPAERAKDYFLEMGWDCPERQTTADFLTSVTSTAERRPRRGYEDVVPTSPKEFYERWRESPERARLLAEIDEHNRAHVSGLGKQQLLEHHRQRQAKNMPSTSSYLISFGMQVKASVDRNWMRLKGDPSVYLFMILSNSLMGLILASTFFNQKENTGSFYFRGSALFTAILFNSFSSILEIISLFEARSIVEKHKTYAFYHPSADALASIITQLPAKIAICICFNVVFYFMTNLRRTAGAFFFYLLISLTSTFAMSHMFRTLGAACSTLYYAMTPASIMLLIISVYVGFSIPKDSIHGWSKWLYYLNPIARSMEAMTANEFDGRNFTCSSIIPSGPGYENVALENQVCSAVGSTPGSMVVSGTRYIALAYDYHASHKWRNWVIVLAYAIFFLIVYLVLIEYNKGEMQKGEVIVFLRSQLKKLKRNHGVDRDLEAHSNEKSESSGGEIERIGSDDIFHWRDVCYDVQIKKETRRILNSVDGYIKPGSLTALMGCSGAGKTTLLDVLANRTTTGVISGNMFVNGRPRDASFQRSTGYCQQQDLHGRTQTVREALQFSAYLRQPANVSKAEKDAYVEDIIHLLEMDAYADAVVGEVGEGLNVEQRKRLTIGVELVARPGLLLFLDEPTSGLDSQTAWSICQLIRKLADRGQAIVCTIHQPSSILMEFFDRLLLLQSGGRTVYFGDLGKGSSTMIEYFEKHGSQKFPKDCNPADFMLEVIGAAPGSHAKQNYHEVWKNSEEYRKLQEELHMMETELVKKPVEENEYLHKEFASTFWEQYKVVTKRVFIQYWRTPGYVWSKILLGVFSAIFVGFSFFKASNSIQGLQNQMFASFTFLMVCTPLIQQMLPQFVEQRKTYEVRERPSKTFSWQAFLLAQVTIESMWAIIVGTMAFFCFYYPIDFGHNATGHADRLSRGAFTWLIAVTYYMFCVTLGQLCVAAIEIEDNATNMANFFFMICIVFCGVLVSKDKMPGFWIWMYRISPLTYIVSALLSTGIGRSEIKCATHEYVTLTPPSGMSCGQYLEAYIGRNAGYILDPSSVDMCSYCPMSKTDHYLKSVNIYFKHRYRDWAIFLCFVVTNIIGFIFLYWYFRVPKSNFGKRGLFGKAKSK